MENLEAKRGRVSGLVAMFLFGFILGFCVCMLCEPRKYQKNKDAEVVFWETKDTVSVGVGKVQILKEQ